MTKVVLTRLETLEYTENEIVDTVENVLDKLDFNFNNNIRRVIIKPNLCYYWHHSTGETTDPRVVSAVIDYIRSKLGSDVEIFVAEADASAMRTKFAFKVLEFDKLSKRKKVKLINLSEGKISEVPVTVKGKNIALPINELLLNADLLINVPKLKIQRFIGVTCGMKNMFGAISKPRKYTYHKMISHVIVGINKIVKSHIIIVDGLIAKGSYAKKMGVILAGDDVLATDATAARIMSFNPRRIPYLNIAAKEHVGQTSNIQLIEDVKLEDLKKEFPHYNRTLHNFSWNLQLKMLRTYAKLVGDVVPPFMEQ
jgi:uncharacterized protein (DUF362 family)